MKTTIIGYPRIGCGRELKKATENYFQNKISPENLNEQAKSLRKIHWEKQISKGIDLPVSNDFSFYDTLLDTALLFGLIPERFTVLPQDPLIRTFAMARGYKKDGYQASALAMKKWFTTNYHYMVPEVDESSSIGLSGHKPLTEFREALSAGFLTRPMLTGPYTLLRLTRFSGETSAVKCAQRLIPAYAQLLSALGAAGAKWVQLDEPCLCLDMDASEKAFFHSLYQRLGEKNPGVKIQLQTAFGDITQVYDSLSSLPVQAIGLDFVEGQGNLLKLESDGFPEDKILVAGIVNGRNVWRNNYKKSLDIISRISKHLPAERIWLSPSCSLLHLPYSLGPETGLSPELRDILAFAEEKMEELGELSILSAENKPENHPIFLRNQQRFEQAEKIPGRILPEVRNRTSFLRDQSFLRMPDAEARKSCQQNRLNLPPFPTTSIGSFPQTAEIRAMRRLYRKGEVKLSEYEAFLRKRTEECVKLQDDMGLDVLVHGEFERNDMVEYFGEQLDGFIFTENAWVQSYGTRCVKPPILMGDVRRPCPMTVDTWRFAAGCTKKPVKGMLTGPVTILNWSFVRDDVENTECLLQLALAIREEVLDLEAAGCAIIQIDEAALREKLPLKKKDWKSYLDNAVNAFHLCHDGVRPDTQIHTHMCYSEFGDILEAIDAMDADVITIEAARSALTLVDQLKKTPYARDIGPGVYDIHSPLIPGEEDILLRLDTLLSTLEPEQLWINPDCGLKTRSPKEAEESLKAMVNAAKKLREKYRS
ncbi:5-methyltetrahydropteroyltriglutamate--homocysteine S-methyltransferase [Desulfobotulus mexicanus]|uniref:5-methyltetrahydropteroyltriglutamate--homocysteine methyltransferase n=1 Tax=Desulfobotulus mexicanus TaxID=2586642 RepID=A0A5Q4VFB5_9BACT|nr:5-methyltetrahydropteroyltriglutamate--homocysteine S-methyltransferase [Desulfobotulus mexicanus]TYT74860.1 5-methyltetrahydropteroyltriglutamate--homocysteine S-methyltransferase [Desulfobotulus mexicanus]